MQRKFRRYNSAWILYMKTGRQAYKDQLDKLAEYISMNREQYQDWRLHTGRL